MGEWKSIALRVALCSQSMRSKQRTPRLNVREDGGLISEINLSCISEAFL